ncbi:rsbT co-antagonist protein RsbR [Salsuginibacillus halophilus]|uniref:RsbT co-antagonist protein RsbR n=1 Tax=Salsuginibacillus halophilus TaxID=517424 RepID=A0A2P8HDY3_9BACI|nr:STAS domain-containing protein [Salsuginibacillus halophilus]PSL44415.1 rsbT co-antagonist protein RsbR [Salsuginibacillus halophilus]
MPQFDKGFPLPCFYIDKRLTITSTTGTGVDKYLQAASFLTLVEEGSRSKLQTFLSGGETAESPVEVNLYLRNQKFQLVDLYMSWESELHGVVVVVPKQNVYDQSALVLEGLRGRLRDTNFQLYEEKEKLSKIIDEKNALSAPFITLSSKTALVPLFGDIEAEKMKTIETHVLQRAYSGGYDLVFFDFTGVGDITDEGFQVLENIVRSMSYLGPEIVIVGLRPAHARQVYELRRTLNIQFQPTLEQALHLERVNRAQAVIPQKEADTDG